MKQIITQKIIKKDKWLYELSNSITEPKQLLKILNLENYPEYYQYKSNTLFPFRVPYSFISRMQKNNPKDPLLLQVMTNNQEFLNSSEYVNDPTQEKKNIVLPGLLHKYHDRVLLLVKTNCAIHCRYCFRKNFPYEKNQGKKINWINSLLYIKKKYKLK